MSNSDRIVTAGVVCALGGAVYFVVRSFPRFSSVPVAKSRTAGQDEIHTSLSQPYPESYSFKSRRGEETMTIVLRGGGKSGEAGKGSKMTPVLHLHVHHSETFRVMSGIMRMQLDNKEMSVSAESGEIVVPPGVAHTFWVCSTSPSPVSVTIPLSDSKPEPRAFFENIVGLQRDYDYDPPLLALFVILAEHEVYPATAPLPLAKALVRAGAWLGRLMGYQPYYREYTTHFPEGM